MSLETTLVPTEDEVQHPPIQQDEIAEEVFAARRYAKRLTRTVVMAQLLCVYSHPVR